MLPIIKALSTDTTSIQFFTGVYCDVSAKIALVPEDFLANTACVGHLPGIHSVTGGESRVLNASLPTGLAWMKFPSKLGPLVVVGKRPSVARV